MIQVTELTAWLLWGLYLLVIFSLSELPGGIVPMPIRGFDKFLHFIEYIPLPVVTLRAFATLPWKFARKRLFLCVIAFGALYAASDELHQITNPTRQVELYDFIADTLGVLAGTWLVRDLHRVKPLHRLKKRFARGVRKAPLSP